MIHETEQNGRPAPAEKCNGGGKEMVLHHLEGDWQVRDLDATRKTIWQSRTAGGGEQVSCPICGCRSRIKDFVSIKPQMHAIHQCLGCGCWFDDLGPACPTCRSSGEYLGYVDVPGRGIYTQYRCRRCGHGFMLKMQESTDDRQQN